MFFRIFVSSSSHLTLDPSSFLALSWMTLASWDLELAIYCPFLELFQANLSELSIKLIGVLCLSLTSSSLKSCLSIVTFYPLHSWFINSFTFLTLYASGFDELTFLQNLPLSHMSSHTLILPSFPTCQLQPFFNSALDSFQLFQIQESPALLVASKISPFEKYLYFIILDINRFGLAITLHIYLHKRAALKASKSLNPMPPLSFVSINFSHAIQCNFLLCSPLFHQKFAICPDTSWHMPFGNLKHDNVYTGSAWITDLIITSLPAALRNFVFHLLIFFIVLSLI